MSSIPSSRRVLLVDTDVDALGHLASALRARGLTVFNANEAFDAVEQAFQKRPEVVLAARSLVGATDLVDAFQAVPEIADTPVLFLVDDDRALADDEVPRRNLELLVTRVVHAAPRGSSVPMPQELRGNLEQMPLVDLIQMLSMNRRSGVLSVTTSAGAGEVRVSEGEVVDAVYRRLEAEKAMFRLLGERDGRFAFSPGEPLKVRRIQMSTSVLLMEAMRHLDEVLRYRQDLAPNGEALLFEEISSVSRRPPELSSPRPMIAGELVQILQVPRSIDEILDEMPAPDLEILEALEGLHKQGKLRTIPIAELTTPFATPEQLPLLRSLVTRLSRAGFAPPPRIVIVASVKRMPALAHAVRRITDAVAPSEPPPRAALPRPLGTLRLGDGVELALTGLPGEPAFAPTWPLALAGAAAIVRLGEAGGAALEAAAQAVEGPVLEAETLMGAVDVAVPAQVAALLRSALEAAAGV